MELQRYLLIFLMPVKRLTYVPVLQIKVYCITKEEIGSPLLFTTHAYFVQA